MKIAEQRPSQLQTREEIDDIFEEILRPLQSKNARHIFLVLRDSNQEYLTTYDIQPILEKNGNKLSKVELNNWLSSLLEAGLVQKANERGKPTTRNYNRRYTFDLWNLTKKGIEISNLLKIFNRNVSSQKTEGQKIEIERGNKIEKIIGIKVKSNFLDLSNITYEDLDTIRPVFMNLILMKTLKTEGNKDLMSLSKTTGLMSEKIIEFIEMQEKLCSTTLYQMSEIPMDLGGKILEKLGLSTRKNYILSLSSEGKLMAASFEI